jgi:tRNA nucleotidyltransferase/poly(A) polymerase
MEMETESDKEFRVEKIEVASNCLMKDFFTFLSFPQLSPPQLSPPSFQEGVRGSFSVRDFLIRDEHGTLVKIVNYDDVLKCLVAMEIFDETFGLNFTLKNDFFKNKIEYFDNFDNLEKYKKNNDLLDIKNVKILNVINVLIRIIVLAEKEDIKLFLVGGQVRDLLLDISDFENDEKLEAVRFLKKIIENERDFDLVVFCNNSSKDAIYFANALKNNFNLNKNQFKAETKSEILIKTNEQFKTVNVVLKSIEHDFEFSFDIATARDEKYAFSGALPEVSKAENLVSDIRRRDITINSMLLSLNRLDFGRIFDFYQGGRDLRDKKIRVNYPTSFIDDPTRIFRVIRFAVRLGFEIEENTRELLVQASEQLLVNKISKDRILNEIKKNFSEKDVIGNIRMMQEYGFLNAISEKIGSLLPLSQEGDTEGVSRRAIDVIDGFVVEGERICRETPSSSLLERGRTREEGKREIVKDDFNGLKLDTWFVWFLAVVKDLDFCERERIVREFGFFKSKKNALLENLEFLKTGEYKKLENMDDAEVYFCLKDGNFSFEFLVFCAFSVEANNENETIKNEKMEKIKNKILKYLNETRKIRLEIDGEYLKELGLVEGKQIGEILRKILGLKILKKNNENGVFGIEEEKKYALEFVKKLKS